MGNEGERTCINGHKADLVPYSLNCIELKRTLYMVRK